MNSQTSSSPRPKTIGYLRVSATERDLQKNKGDILTLANDNDLCKVHWIEGTVSGTIPWCKRAVGRVYEALQPGDKLVASELPRLGRSMLECMEILSIVVQRSINIYIVKDAWRLGNTIQSKIVAMAFSMATKPKTRPWRPSWTPTLYLSTVCVTIC